MSVENVKKFYEAVSQDEALKQKFVEISQKYQGQPMDEAKAMSLTEKEIVPLAEKMGYSFSMDELKAYGEEIKQVNMNRELCDSELDAVTGGIFACFVIGAGDQGGGCFLVGIDSLNQLCILGGSTIG